MRGCLSNSCCTGKELVDELLRRLLGCARDIVLAWLHNNVHVSASGDDDDAVYCILRQHFDSAVRIGMPLTDFYATTSYANEQ